MKHIIKIILFLITLSLTACANYKFENSLPKKEKQFYSSNGFALVYEDTLFEQKVVNKKLNNNEIIVFHSILKKNTPIKIINPINSKTIDTKIAEKANYPKIFNILISKKVATVLELDFENPYLEIIEIKKNKTFIAKEGKIFDEEKNVAEKAPVDEIEIDNLLQEESTLKKKTMDKRNYVLVIADFFYFETADKLKLHLAKETQIKNFSIKKINNTKYRLLVGPFTNFNSLKSTYISLNNLGFEDLNIYKE